MDWAELRRPYLEQAEDDLPANIVLMCREECRLEEAV